MSEHGNGTAKASNVATVVVAVVTTIAALGGPFAFWINTRVSAVEESQRAGQSVDQRSIEDRAGLHGELARIEQTAAAKFSRVETQIAGVWQVLGILWRTVTHTDLPQIRPES